MTERSKQDRPTSISNQIDESHSNPAGTSRRRLVQALGVAGASGLISLQWSRPIVSIGGLTAHAQGSCLAPGATLMLEVTKDGTGSASMNQVDSDGTTVLTEFAFTDSFSISGTLSGSSETAGLVASASWATGTTLQVQFSATCCTEEISPLLQPTETATGLAAILTAIFDDDGSCQLGGPSEQPIGERVTITIG